MTAADGSQLAFAATAAGVAALMLLMLLVLPSAARRWRPSPLTARGMLVLAVTSWLASLAPLVPTEITAAASDATLAAGAAVAVCAAAAIAWLARHHASWMLVPLAAVLPLRVPVTVGEETYNLLVPLYAVLLVALLTLLASRAGGTSVSPQVAARPGAPSAHAIDLAVGLMVVVASLSLWWSADATAGLIDVGLAFVPFGMLYLVVRRLLPLASQRVRHMAGGAFLVVMAAAAAIGLWQRATQTLWQNPKVIVANEFSSVFRTNSIFWDPNIYGRYLVAALLVLLCALAFARLGPRVRLLVPGLASVLAVALWFTYSQSSFLALAAGSLALASFLVSRRSLAAAGTALVLATLMLVPAAHVAGVLDEEGRVGLIGDGIELARQAPVIGHGIGSFEHGVRELALEQGERVPRLRSSHVTPITVLAELGALGMLAYLALLAAVVHAAARLRAVRDRHGSRVLAGMWAAAVFAAVAVHSLMYAGFFEDPLGWVVTAVLAGAVQSVVPTSLGSSDVAAASSGERMAGIATHSGT